MRWALVVLILFTMGNGAAIAAAISAAELERRCGSLPTLQQRDDCREREASKVAAVKSVAATPKLSASKAPATKGAASDPSPYVIYGVSVLFALFLLSIVSRRLALAKAKKALTAELMDNSDEFRPRFFFLSLDVDTAMAIDDGHKLVGLASLDAETKIIKYSSVLAAELVEDGTTVTRTARDSQLGTALVGGLLFGTTGAVVGALTGTKETRKKVKQVQLKLTINDHAQPLFHITFLNTECEAGSRAYKEALTEANEWIGRFKVVMAHAEQAAKTVARDTEQALARSSVADELAKLGSLVERGLLSRDEYEAQKGRLLA